MCGYQPLIVFTMISSININLFFSDVAALVQSRLIRCNVTLTLDPEYVYTESGIPI